MKQKPLFGKGWVVDEQRVIVEPDEPVNAVEAMWRVGATEHREFSLKDFKLITRRSQDESSKIDT